jgi:hypothetical protein
VRWIRTGLAAAPPVAGAARGIVRRAEQLSCIRARHPRPFGSRPPIGLAVCAIFRDEARYLAEWVTFHRVQGVERFWLYDNLSEDNWRAALAPEIASGLVTVTPWPDEPGQASAYIDCLKRHRTDARWVAFIDVDEFLFSPSGHSLPEVLRRFDRYPAVVANWRMYGTNGYAEPPAGLVIESYLLRGKDDHLDNRWVKAIVFPAKTTWAGSVHHFNHSGIPVGEDQRPQFHDTRLPATAKLLRINHYYTRSATDWERKRTRPVGSDGLIRETSVAPEDDVRDETILHFAPPLRQALASRTRG